MALISRRILCLEIEAVYVNFNQNLYRNLNPTHILKAKALMKMFDEDKTELN